MFPISWSTIFRKKDGSLVNMEDAISGGGGGGGYTLPTATASRLGGVKIGSGVTVEEDGTISVSGGGGGARYKVYTYQYPNAEGAGDDKYLLGDTMAHFGMETGDELIAIEPANGAFINLRGTSASNQAGKAYKNFVPSDTMFLYGKCVAAVNGSSTFGYINFIYKTS